MSKAIRLSVMGAGLIGKRHIEQILARPEAGLASIIDPTSAARELAQSLNVAWYPFFQDIAPEDRPEGIIVATPNQMHVANGMECIEAGLPVLIEKPIADDLVGAEALVDSAERRGVPLLVGHHRRHDPMIQRAKEEIDSGRLGQIVSVHGMFWLIKPDDYFDVAWRREKGAGPILLNLIHDVDLLRYLCGEIVAVQARPIQPSPQRRRRGDRGNHFALRLRRLGHSKRVRHHRGAVELGIYCRRESGLQPHTRDLLSNWWQADLVSSSPARFVASPEQSELVGSAGA